MLKYWHDVKRHGAHGPKQVHCGEGDACQCERHSNTEIYHQRQEGVRAQEGTGGCEIKDDVAKDLYSHKLLILAHGAEGAVLDSDFHGWKPDEGVRQIYGMMPQHTRPRQQLRSYS